MNNQCVDSFNINHFMGFYPKKQLIGLSIQSYKIEAVNSSLQMKKNNKVSKYLLILL